MLKLLISDLALFPPTCPPVVLACFRFSSYLFTIHFLPPSFPELKDGDGDVLVNTNPFVEPDTQYSVREAVAIAENFTNVNVSNKDLVVSFAINGTLIGGPSAGAATTVDTIVAMEGAQVRQDMAITGTIEEGGYIGQVGGAFDKAVAAEKNGMTLFLVPNGQKKVIYY